MIRLLSTWAVGCGLAFSAFGATWVVSGVVNTAAPNGVHVASSVKIQNRGAASTVTLALIPAAGDTSPTPITQPILPGQTLVLANPLRNLWGIENRADALTVTCDQSLVITSSVAQDAATPSPYGGGGAAIRYEDLLVADEWGDVLWVTPAASATPFDSIVGVVLATPDASVDIVVYDSNGNEAARNTVGNGPAVVEMPATTIVPPGIASARVEFQVSAGRVAGYLRNFDQTTGDPWFSLAPTEEASSIFLTAGAAGTAATTSIRVMNTDSYDIASVAVSFYGGYGGTAQATATITLQPGQMLEYTDVMNDLFQLPGASGALDFEGTYSLYGVYTYPEPIVIESHTLIASGAGNYGDVQPALTVAQFLQSGSTATLTGIEQSPVNGQPSFNYAAGVVAGPAGATADATLYDNNGNVLATLPGAVQLNAYQSMETPVTTMFSGVTLPEDAELDVSITAGTLYTYGRSVALATGDWSLAPASHVEKYWCPVPVVQDFTTSQLTFSQPGTADLSWSAYNADSVTITPDVGMMPTFGTTTVNVAASTTYQIQANGVCGQANATVSIAYGPPQLTAISPTSGIAGQVVTFTFANLTDPTTVAGANITYPDGTSSVAPLNTDANGNQTFAIPLVHGIGDPSNGDYSGPVTVAAQFADGTATATLPFTVNPIVYQGDAVSDFGQWFNGMVSEVQDVMAQQSQLPGSAAAITALTGSMNNDIAAINQMLSDIAANGTAVLASEPATSDYPNPQPVTVARSDIEAMMTLINGFNPPASADGAQLRKNSAARKAQSPKPHAGSAGPCLADSPLYATCQQVELIDPNSAMVQTWNAIMGAVNAVAGVLDWFAKDPRVIALNKIARIIQKPGFYCNLYPVFLDSFYPSPNPTPVPVGPFNQRPDNHGTEIWASLKPRWTKEQATDLLVGQVQSQLLSNLSNQTKSLSPAGQQLVQSQATTLMNWLYNSVRNDVQNMLSQLGVIQTANNVQVYTCDLLMVEPQGGSQNPLLARDVDEEQFLTGNVYGLWGKRQSGLTYINVTTFASHFVQLSPSGTGVLIPGRNAPMYNTYVVPITVGLGATTLTVTQTDVNQSVDAPGATPPITSIQITTPRTFMVTSQTKFDYTFSNSILSVAAHISKQSSTRYQINVTLTGTPSSSSGVEPGISVYGSVNVRKSPGNTQQVGFSGTAMGTCPNSACYESDAIGYNGNGSPPGVSSGPIVFGQTINQSWNFTSTGVTNGGFSISLSTGSGSPTKASFTGTITLPPR